MSTPHSDNQNPLFTLELWVPFSESLQRTIASMANIELKPGEIVKHAAQLAAGEVTGFISLVGERYSGSLALSFEGPLAMRMASNMLAEEFTTVDDVVSDTIGEITNIVLGVSKAPLAEHGFRFEMSQPVVIRGRGVEIHHVSAADTVIQTFQSTEGNCWMEFSFSTK